MTKSEAAQFAIMKLKEHGLWEQGWRFGWNRRKRALGLCDYKKKSIFLSEHQFQIVNSDKMRDTILHEVAHALAGGRAGHGPIWKAYCRSVGANPNRAYTATENEYIQMAAASKYVIKCSKCRNQWPANRRKKHPMNCYVCPKCKVSGTLTMYTN